MNRRELLGSISALAGYGATEVVAVADPPGKPLIVFRVEKRLPQHQIEQLREEMHAQEERLGVRILVVSGFDAVDFPRGDHAGVSETVGDYTWSCRGKNIEEVRQLKELMHGTGDEAEAISWAAVGPLTSEEQQLLELERIQQRDYPGLLFR